MYNFTVAKNNLQLRLIQLINTTVAQVIKLRTHS